jgi:hypothetical protein
VAARRASAARADNTDQERDMDRRSAINLSMIASFALVLSLSSAIGQTKSLKDQLVGSWTFVSSVDTDKDSKKSDRWGPDAKGLAIFDASGHFSFMISRGNLPKFAASNVNQGTADENKAVLQGLIAMIGTWTVDEAGKTLITNIEAGSFPNFNGTSQKRIIVSLTGDEMKYTNPATSTGAMTEAVWKRAK